MTKDKNNGGPFKFNGRIRMDSHEPMAKQSTEKSRKVITSLPVNNWICPLHRIPTIPIPYPVFVSSRGSHPHLIPFRASYFHFLRVDGHVCKIHSRHSRPTLAASAAVASGGLVNQPNCEVLQQEGRQCQAQTDTIAHVLGRTLPPV